MLSLACLAQVLPRQSLNPAFEPGQPVSKPCINHMLQPSSWQIFKFLLVCNPKIRKWFHCFVCAYSKHLGQCRFDWRCCYITILRPVIVASIAATSNELVTSALDTLGNVSWIAAAVPSIPRPVIGASIAATSNKLVTSALDTLGNVS